LDREYWHWQSAQREYWTRMGGHLARAAVLAGERVPNPEITYRRFCLLKDMGELGDMDTNELILRLRTRLHESPGEKVRLTRLLHFVQNPPQDERLKPFYSALVASETAVADLEQHAAKWRALGSHTEQGVQDMLRPKRTEVRERLATLREQGVAPAINRLAASLAPRLPDAAPDETRMLEWFAALKPTERVMALQRAANGEDTALAAALIRPENQRYLSDPMSGRHKFLSARSTDAMRSVFIEDRETVEATAQYAQFVDAHLASTLASMPKED